MKLYLSTLALTLLLAFMADMRITLWPFSISFGRPWLALGTILIMCGCLCLKAQWYSDAVEDYKEHVKKEIKMLKEEQIKEKL
jgi:hypothetical protein